MWNYMWPTNCSNLSKIHSEAPSRRQAETGSARAGSLLADCSRAVAQCCAWPGRGCCAGDWWPEGVVSVDSWPVPTHSSVVSVRDHSIDGWPVPFQQLFTVNSPSTLYSCHERDIMHCQSNASLQEQDGYPLPLPGRVCYKRKHKGGNPGAASCACISRRWICVTSTW